MIIEKLKEKLCNYFCDDGFHGLFVSSLLLFSLGFISMFSFFKK